MRLTEHEARERFSAARVARLATVGKDRVPHLVPLVFVVDGDVLYSAVDHKPKSGAPLRRLENIAADPAVCLLADEYDDDWARLWWARADGRAHIVDAADAEHPLDLLVRRYPQYRGHRPRGPVVAVDVLRWSGWSGAG